MFVGGKKRIVNLPRRKFTNPNQLYNSYLLVHRSLDFIPDYSLRIAARVVSRAAAALAAQTTEHGANVT